MLQFRCHWRTARWLLWGSMAWLKTDNWLPVAAAASECTKGCLCWAVTHEHEKDPEEMRDWMGPKLQRDESVVNLKMVSGRMEFYRFPYEEL